KEQVLQSRLLLYSQVHYSATCDPVWSQHFPLLPLLTAVIVTRHFLKVIVIPFD
ncbi:hypothetical protein SERLA73DRAFT_192301, partial [Serpula lacrymans var. lacrymans S7.3]